VRCLTVGRGGLHEVGKGLAGDVALEAAHDLGLGLALGDAASDVVAGGLVVAHPDQGDTPKGTVRIPVTAAVQSVPVGASRADRDRGGSATRSGATAVTRADSSLFKSSISACRVSRRRAALRSASLVAAGGSVIGPGRRAAQPRMRCLPVSPRSDCLTVCGAETIRASIWLLLGCGSSSRRVGRP
jgi:hypothetical protein